MSQPPLVAGWDVAQDMDTPVTSRSLPSSGATTSPHRDLRRLLAPPACLASQQCHQLPPCVLPCPLRSPLKAGSCCPSRVGARSFPAPCSVISDRHACGRQPQVSPTPRHQPCPPRVHGGVAVSPEAQAAGTHRGVLSSLACPRTLVTRSGEG